MNLEVFHNKLLANGTKAPAEFRLSPVHQALYNGFEAGKRGYVLPKAGSREDPERFLACFVVAVYQTTIPTPAPVVLCVPRPVEKWAYAQIRTIATRIFAVRREAPQEDIHGLRDAIRRINMGSSVVQIMEAPERWVAFGFMATDLLPPWMRGHLVTKVRS